MGFGRRLIDRKPLNHSWRSVTSFTRGECMSQVDTQPNHWCLRFGLMKLAGFMAAVLLLMPCFAGAQSSHDVVLYAAEAPVRQGAWTIVNDATAAGGRRLHDNNVSTIKA